MYQNRNCFLEQRAFLETMFDFVKVPIKLFRQFQFINHFKAYI
jgi:hypothetical protein